MKAFIVLVIFAAVYYFGRTVYREFESKRAKEDQAAGRTAAPAPAVTDASLPGLPDTLEASLANAQQQGSTGMKAWLDRYQSHIQDPRLGAIQLDYVLMISRDDPRAAKKIYQDVKARTPTNSPIYQRVKRLSNTYD